MTSLKNLETSITGLTEMITTLNDAEAQIMEFGLEPQLIELDGRYHRCVFSGEKRSKMSGYYKLKEVSRGDNILVDGIYGSFKVSERPIMVERRVELGITSEKAKRIKEEYQKKAALEREKEKEEQEIAAQRADLIWDDAEDEGESPYLERKQVKAYGVKFHKSTVIIPMVKERRLTGLQSIGASGFKKYLQHSDVKGAMHLIAGSSRVALCEGYSTGASIHEATGWSVAICFSANGLVACAPYFKKKDAVICADNDLATKEKIGKNPGLIAGKKAAEYLECPLFLPQFDTLEFSDFNDLHVNFGLDEVRKQCLI